MKGIISTASAAAIVLSIAATGAVVSTVTSAEAKVITKWEYQNRDKCYKAKRVPATVQYNTKGKLKKAASRVWVGNPQKHGSKVVDKYNDAVYFQTRTVIEEQHVTLVPVKC